MKRIETVKSYAYPAAIILFFFLFWKYAPNSVTKPATTFLKLLLMAAFFTPFIVSFAALWSTVDAPRTWRKVVRRVSLSNVIAAFVFLNLYIYAVLALFFDGGAYPFGKISGNTYIVVSDAVVEGLHVQVSHGWFWFTYWQGVVAWSGMGAYGSARFIQAMYGSIRSDSREHTARYIAGFVFSIIWLSYVIWNAIRIVH